MDTELLMKVECPRCHRILIAHAGEDHVECNCHLYCDEGNDPTDCSVTYQNYSGQLGWPTGLNTNDADEGSHVLQRMYYCSTHEKYYYKDKVTVVCNWERWRSRRRAPREMRMSHGKY